MADALRVHESLSYCYYNICLCAADQCVPGFAAADLANHSVLQSHHKIHHAICPCIPQS